jgi:hypothetical protein
MFSSGLDVVCVHTHVYPVCFPCSRGPSHLPFSYKAQLSPPVRQVETRHLLLLPVRLQSSSIFFSQCIPSANPSFTSIKHHVVTALFVNNLSTCLPQTPLSSSSPWSCPRSTALSPSNPYVPNAAQDCLEQAY